MTFLLICGLIASLVFNGILLLRYTESDKAYNILDRAYNGMDQAYTELNTTYNALNQAYAELNNANSRLESSYGTLNQTYQMLLSNIKSHSVRNVETGAEYATIQEAINGAENGSTIMTNAGVYYEHVTIDKTLTLLGVSKEDTIIDGSESGDVIAITSDNVTIKGFTVRNSSRGLDGIHLYHSMGCIVTGNVATLNGWAGIEMDDSSNNTVSENIVSKTGFDVGGGGLTWGDGIKLSNSSNNTISENVITGSFDGGISLDDSDNNSVYKNTIEHNGNTIFAHTSNNNMFFQNNFLHNVGWQLMAFSPNNSWSINGQGNYWYDYAGLDDGSNGRIAGDGIGDTNLPWNGVDNYPVISPVNPIQIFWNNQAFPTSLMSNSTVSAFRFDQTGKRIAFSVTGPSNSKGYFNLTMPITLLNGSWEILVDGTDATSQAMVTENTTQATIYLSYNQSSHDVQVIGTSVIPEYPNAQTSLLTLLIVLTPVILLVSNKRKNTLRKKHKNK